MTDGQIHWFSIINSVMIVLFLSGMVAMIMARTLHRDISKYNQLDAAEEGQEETGWKLVRGGVGVERRGAGRPGAAGGAGGGWKGRWYGTPTAADTRMQCMRCGSMRCGRAEQEATWKVGGQVVRLWSCRPSPPSLPVLHNSPTDTP
jgi:hypothetical protein